MEQFIRTTDDEQRVFDYDWLDIQDRANWREYISRWASEIEVDLESEPDASNAEKVEAIDNTCSQLVDTMLAYFPDDVAIDSDTEAMIKEQLARELAKRYNVTLD